MWILKLIVIQKYKLNTFRIVLCINVIKTPKYTITFCLFNVQGSRPPTT